MAKPIITLYPNYPVGTNPQEQDIDNTFPNPTNAYGWECVGYEFSHWNSNPNDTGITKNIGDEANNEGSSYFYAIWTIINVNYLTNTSELTAIADAIREKGETTAQLSYPAGFISAISAIETGGGSVSGYTIDDIAIKSIISGNIQGSASFIGSYAFAFCNKITIVSFSACTSISSYAFFHCDSLQRAYFQNCLRVEGLAFANCSLLTTASFPSCTSISASGFYYCSALTEPSFPKCTSIANSAFYSCRYLKSISLPACVSIGQYAFRYCSSLSTVYLGTNISYIATYAFGNCPYLISLYLSTASKVPSLANSQAFYSTPIAGYSASAGRYGSIYVPSSLLASFKTATNWSVYSNRMVGV